MKAIACGLLAALAAPVRLWPTIHPPRWQRVGSCSRSRPISAWRRRICASVPKEVRVRYEFVNDGKKDVETVVAFPLPDIDVREFWYEPLGTTLDTSPNFMGFALTVDGRKVDAKADERAVLNGRDVTAQVKAAGLPVNIVGGALVKKLDRLAPDSAQIAARAGLPRRRQGRHPSALDREDELLVAPGLSGRQDRRHRAPLSACDRAILLRGRLAQLTRTKAPPTRKPSASMRRRAQPSKRRIAKLDKNGPNGAYLQAYTTEFVLKTANNWKGPIGRFHLTLDKLKPENVLSLCWDGDLKKTGATTFEAARENFAPTRDIKLLVLQ